MKESTWRETGRVIVAGESVDIPDNLNFLWVARLFEEDHGIEYARIEFKENLVREFNRLPEKLTIDQVVLGREVGISGRKVSDYFEYGTGPLGIYLLLLSKLEVNRFWEAYAVMNANFVEISQLVPSKRSPRKRELARSEVSKGEVLWEKADVTTYLERLHVGKSSPKLAEFNWPEIIDSLLVKHMRSVELGNSVSGVINGR